MTLRKSAMVGLMDCYDREHIRLSMMARGVNKHRIGQLDLEANNASTASLHYFVQGMTEQK